MNSYPEFKLTELFAERVKGAKKTRGANVILTFKRLPDVDAFLSFAQAVMRKAKEGYEPDFDIKQTTKALKIICELAEQNMLDIAASFDPHDYSQKKEAGRQRLALQRLHELQERLEKGFIPTEMQQPIKVQESIKSGNPFKDYPELVQPSPNRPIEGSRHHD